MGSIGRCCAVLLIVAARNLAQETRTSPPPTRQAPARPPPAAGGLTRCYANWGCFSISEPFFSPARPVSLYPADPGSLRVSLLLLTRRSPDMFEKLLNHRNSSFSGFEVGRTVKIIIHGYMEDGYQEWIKEMARELLTAEDCNVISVDWKLGAGPPYPQAVANSRSVGLVVADFIEFLQRLYRVLPGDVHLIGHSLGAHIAGYAGERIPRLARITGLDPAGPYFQDTDPRVRLDPLDALFVDVIHTPGNGNALVPVMQQECGHVDFYPSGGWRRPVCDVAYPANVGHCTSVRAYQYFSESVNTDCPYDGFICDNYGNFSAGRCAEGCGPDLSLCAPLGYRASDWQRFSSGHPPPVRMFLETGIAEPYCRFHYHIQMDGMDADGRRANESGTLFVRLVGTKGKTALLQASREILTFGPGVRTEFVVSAPNLGRLLRLDMVWTPIDTPYVPRTFRPQIPRIGVQSFKVTNLETYYREAFCSSGEPIDPQTLKTFFAGGIC